MKKYQFLLLADVLFSVYSRAEQGRWFPPQLSFFEKLGNVIGQDFSQKRLLAWFDRRSMETFQEMLVRAKASGPYDGLIGAGNYTIGTNESGMITPECLGQLEFFMYKLRRYFPDEFFLKTPGGHDVGYRYIVKERTGFAIGLESGGMSEESVDAFMKNLGPLFQRKTIGPATFVSISSNLIKNVNDDSPEKLRLLKCEQAEFLKSCLGEKEDFFLVMHDPTALSHEMHELILSNKHKIRAIIHGHCHCWQLRWLTLFHSPYLKLCKSIPVILADAPWGTFGIGKAFKILEVDEEGGWKTKRYSL